MAVLWCACALLFIYVSDVVTARRPDAAHVSGQTKVAIPTNTHAESFDTSRFASETAESEVCVLSFIKWNEKACRAMIIFHSSILPCCGS